MGPRVSGAAGKPRRGVRSAGSKLSRTGRILSQKWGNKQIQLEDFLNSEDPHQLASQRVLGTVSFQEPRVPNDPTRPSEDLVGVGFGEHFLPISAGKWAFQPQNHNKQKCKMCPNNNREEARRKEGKGYGFWSPTVDGCLAPRTVGGCIYRIIHQDF